MLKKQTTYSDSLYLTIVVMFKPLHYYLMHYLHKERKVRQ